MTSPISSINRRNNDGFTFIELLLVVMLIGVLAAVVFPRLQGSSRAAALKTSLDTLAEVARMARLESVTCERKARLRWNENGDAYWVEIHKGATLELGGFEPSRDRWLGRRRVLPMGVRIAGVQYGANAEGDASRVEGAYMPGEVIFTPDGIGPAMTIVVRSGDVARFGIALGPWYEDVSVSNTGLPYSKFETRH